MSGEQAVARATEELSSSVDEALDGATFEARARARVEALEAEVDLDAMTLVFDVIRLATRLIQDLEARVHRPAGWSWAGFRVLFSLWVVGALSPRAIARLSGVSRAAVSSVLNTLERDGLVERRREAPDRRRVTVHLTPRGRMRLRRAYPDHNRRESEWAAALPRRDQRLLTDLLRRLLDQHPPRDG
ncbi:MAG: MarR family winged helix-turn-helix transcriptional regulator [Myxococcota bacterium]